MPDEEFASLAAAVLEQVADAVVCADPGGKIVLWNAAAAALFGYAAQQALGQSLDLIIPEHLQKSHWHGFDAAIKSGLMRLAGRPTLTRARHQSGRKLYVEMTFALVKQPDGSVRGAVAMARDVTERIEQQRATAKS
jgi:PAS domain S-box-containing protein